MKNAEKILAAWGMGYSAKVISKDKYEGCVVSVLENYNAPNNTCLEVRYSGRHVNFLRSEEIEDLKICGYIYAGNLAGSGLIPEDQLFMTPDGVGRYFQHECNCTVLLDMPDGAAFEYNLKEIEPSFDNN